MSMRTGMNVCRNIDLPIKRMLSISCCSNNPTSSSTSFSQRPLAASQSQVLPQHQRSRTQTQYKSVPRVSDYHSWHHLSCSSHGHEDELPLGFQPSAADTRRPKLLRYHIQYHSDDVPMCNLCHSWSERCIAIAPSPPVYLPALAWR